MQTNPDNQKKEETEGVARGLRAFSIIEMFAVAVIVGILAAMLIPSVLRETDHATLNQEMANLNSFSNALAQNILATYTIPTATGMASAIASNVAAPLNQVLTNSRNFARSFIVDPNINSVGPLTLPFVQGTNGLSSAPATSARMMIVSTLASAAPPVFTGFPGTFSDIWNTPPNTKPVSWSNWNGNGFDIVIQRINLQPLFYQLILNAQDFTNAIASFSINSGNTNYVRTNGTGWTPGGVGWNRYYLSGSVVGLCNSSGIPLARFVLNRNSSFVFQDGSWNGQLMASTGTNSVGSGAAFATAAESFFVSEYNSAANANNGKGADQATVLGAMANFMLDYTLYADQTVAFSQPGTLTGMAQFLTAEAQNVIVYTGNGNGNNSGILSNP